MAFTSCGDVGVPVIDRVLDAEAPERVVLDGGGRADDGGAAQARELDGGDAHAAAGVVDEHRFAGIERRHAVQRERRCQVVDGHGRRFRVAELVRELESQRGRNHDDVRVAAEARQRHHPIAVAHSRDPRADAVDASGDFVADDDGRFWSVWIEAEAREDVGEVDARGADTEANLALTRRGIGGFPHLEDIRRAVAEDDRLPHEGGQRTTLRPGPHGYLRHQREQRLLRVQPILGLIEYHRRR